MSTEETKAIVRRFLEQVITGKNLTVLGELCADDFAWHGGSAGEVHDLAGFRQLLAPFFSAFPDLAVTLEDMLAEGNQVVARYTWRGTQRGEFFGVPPSGKQVTVPGISIYRIAGGKIAEEWWQEDLLGLMQQLGAIPAPGQPGA